MTLNQYCEGLGKELSSWKFRIDNIIKHFDNLHCDDREKVSGQINELIILSTELNDRIGELENACTISWSPVTKDGYFPHIDFRGNIEENLSKFHKGSGYSIPG